MIMPGTISKISPRKIQSVTLIIVLRNGCQRLRKRTNASRSFTGRKGAAVSCVMMIAVTPEITAAETVVATNFSKLRTPIVEYTATRCSVPAGGEYLYQANALISRMLVMIIGTCAIRLSLKNFGKYSL